MHARTSEAELKVRERDERAQSAHGFNSLFRPSFLDKVSEGNHLGATHDGSRRADRAGRGAQTAGAAPSPARLPVLAPAHPQGRLRGQPQAVVASVPARTSASATQAARQGAVCTGGAAKQGEFSERALVAGLRARSAALGPTFPRPDHRGRILPFLTGDRDRYVVAQWPRHRGA